MTYHFSYSSDGTYGSVMALIDGLPSRGGVVLDLGCGFGAVAEPLAERGFEYVGVDIDAEAVADLRRRGFEAHEGPLWGDRRPPLSQAVAEWVGGRQVSLVLLLDVIEHCPDSDAFLADARDALVDLGRPLLVVSIPNVAHVDVATRLLAGEFAYTPSGLLDRTHVQLWTERRVRTDLGRFGWMQVAENDFVLPHSDQFDPAHPFQAVITPLGGWLHELRARVDECAHVNQFVRAYALVPSPAAATPVVPASPARPLPFLSVVMRTTGDRMVNLREALLCLAAQLDQDFEVELLVHYPDRGRVVAVEELVGEFAPAFATRVRIGHVANGGRARPLNVGLEAARGRYVAFLDDDDLVTARWTATFRAAAEQHPGQTIRSLAVLQDVSRQGDCVDATYVVRSGFRSPYPPAFDFVQHLVANQSPIHTFAVSRRLIEILRMRFDETLAVTEDWDFLLRVSQLSGVHDTGAVTAVYHWWVDRSGSTGAAGPEVWSVTRRQILDKLTAAPVLLSAAAARQVVAWAEEREALTGARARAATAAEARLAAMERSRVWRATLPVRAALQFGRRAGDRLRRARRSVESPRSSS